MIILEDLKPILEPILDGRDDSTEIIEQVMAIDKPMNAEPVDVEAINAEWQEKMDTALAEAKADKEETIKKLFFGSQDVDTSIPDAIDEGAVDEEKDDGTYDPETVTIDELFEKQLIS